MDLRENNWTGCPKSTGSCGGRTYSLIFQKHPGLGCLPIPPTQGSTSKGRKTLKLVIITAWSFCQGPAQAPKSWKGHSFFSRNLRRLESLLIQLSTSTSLTNSPSDLELKNCDQLRRSKGNFPGCTLRKSQRVQLVPLCPSHQFQSLRSQMGM
jgi:hypothetical protein